MPTDFDRIIPTGEFRFQIGLRPGDGARFFAPSDELENRLEERARWIDESPYDFAVALDDAAPLIRDAAAVVAGWQPGLALTEVSPTESAVGLCRRAGRAWEPDWVVLRRDPDGVFRLVAGAVCFPSGWSLHEKIGRPMDEIHDPVPGLNRALARPIHQFLDKLKPGAVWQRDNWGLTADPSLNHHPSRRLIPLTAQASLAATWLRHEGQLLARLPASGGILFAIDVRHHRLDTVASDPVARASLTQALQSMPDDIAAYKGVLEARDALIAQLEI